MSDTNYKGDWQPLAELATPYGYTNPIPFKYWLKSLGVPLVTIRRLPHARNADIQQALERLAERSIDTTPRRRGRPRLTTPQAA
jgi:hypothetical protein